MMRDIEVENGGDAPRIHSMDDYFMTEVEKVCQLCLIVNIETHKSFEFFLIVLIHMHVEIFSPL